MKVVEGGHGYSFRYVKEPSIAIVLLMVEYGSSWTRGSLA